MKQIISRILNHFQKVREAVKRDDGFSLLELLIVIVIIGILGTIVYTRFMSIPDQARVQAASLQIKNFEIPLLQYSSMHSTLPSTEEGLDAIKDYMQNRNVPNDPWGKPYIYRSPGEDGREYDIISSGPDKQEGTADDIVSWELHKKGPVEGEK